MEHKLSNLKHIKQIRLSDEERAYLRGRLAQLVVTPEPVGQPLFARGVQHGLSIALSSFLFIVFVGGSMSAVASRALPGDKLYNLKVNGNERIKAALLRSTEEKVAFAQTRVTNRVTEIKTLAQTKTLTKEKQAIAQKALDENIKDLSVQLSTLSEESPSTALSVTAHLEENLKADKAAIEETSEGEATEATIQVIEGTLKKVSEQEVKILSKEIDQLADELDATSVDAPDIDAAATTDATVKGETTEQDTTPPPVTPVSP